MLGSMLVRRYWRCSEKLVTRRLPFNAKLYPVDNATNHNNLCSRTFSISQVNASISSESSAASDILPSDAESRNCLHKPVMVKEVINILDPKPDQVLVDMTFGAGGHTKALLEHCPHITVYALDRDPQAYRIATELFHNNDCRIKPLLGRFTDLPMLLANDSANPELPQIDGALIDCGVSSMQLDTAERGFSFSRPGPLDMRMGGCRSDDLSAADIVNHMDEAGLCEMLSRYGEESKAELIARAIVSARSHLGRIDTTDQLANIVAMALGGGDKFRQDKLNRPMHVATKTFQALRIFVNNELNQLYNAINSLHSLLKPGGVLAVISFHSLEDRIVKRLFHGIDINQQFNMSLTQRRRHSNPRDDTFENDLVIPDTINWQPLGKCAITPTKQEIDSNPRARSAKLRAARKLDKLTVTK